jgi:hypothetical protein
MSGQTWPAARSMQPSSSSTRNWQSNGNDATRESFRNLVDETNIRVNVWPKRPSKGVKR